MTEEPVAAGRKPPPILLACGHPLAFAGRLTSDQLGFGARPVLVGVAVLAAALEVELVGALGDLLVGRRRYARRSLPVLTFPVPAFTALGAEVFSPLTVFRPMIFMKSII